MFASASFHKSPDPGKALEVEGLVRSAASRVAASSSLELVDIELKRGGTGPLVRIYLDKPGRISLDELEGASREISAILDVEDPIGRSYTLEVSSPGMTRPLKTPADFQRVTSKNIQVAYLERDGESAVEPRVKEVKGRLVSVGDTDVRIAPRDDKGREMPEIRVPLAAIRHAQREISFR